jgi:hypothetical protein
MVHKIGSLDYDRMHNDENCGNYQALPYIKPQDKTHRTKRGAQLCKRHGKAMGKGMGKAMGKAI